MLWEDEFYESGEEIAKRIALLVSLVDPLKVAGIAVEAREKIKLRHAPLLLVRELARRKDNPPGLVRSTLARVIQRPDELAEFLAIYWKAGRCPLAKQVQRGLADAFVKFDAYALAKYNRDGAIKLRDVAFLAHVKPTEEQAEGSDSSQDSIVPAVARSKYKRGQVRRHGGSSLAKLIAGTLPVPDTWETALSAGGKDADKKAIWERLLSESKLGALALLRNLRNMIQASVSASAIRTALSSVKTERVLPFRFIAAARHAPAFEPELEEAMLKCLAGSQRLPGETILLVDVSSSMDAPISAKSDLRRLDAACGLAMLLREIAETISVYTFSNELVQVPARRGFALRDALVTSQSHQGTLLGRAVSGLSHAKRDRLIVITDEQSRDSVPSPRTGTRGYMLNVASAKNGVGYGAWTHVDGWSEAVVDYVRAFENVD